MIRKITLFAIALIAAVSMATAQEADETQILQAQIDSLTARLANVEAKNDKWSKVVAALPKISGYAMMGYSWNNEGEGESNFEIPYVRLSLAGDIGKKFDYKVQVELASPKLIDAYIRWKINPSFNVQLGQFHVPFSLEGPLSPTKMETIGNTPLTNLVCKVPDTRDLGIDIYGKFWKHNDRHLFEYAVGVFQGEGKNKADANKSKDVIGRLKFFPIEELCLTGSYSYGERGAGFVVNNRAAAGFEYKDKALLVRSEYMWHKQGTGNAAVKTDGVYAVAMYTIKKFSPVLRYTFTNEQLGAGYREMSYYTAGLNYAPCKYVKFQLNYTLTTSPTVKDYSGVGFLATAMF